MGRFCTFVAGNEQPTLLYILILGLYQVVSEVLAAVGSQLDINNVSLS